MIAPETDVGWAIRLGVEAGRKTADGRWIATAAISVLLALIFAALMLAGWSRAAYSDERARLYQQRADHLSELAAQAEVCAAKLARDDELLGRAREQRGR